MIDFMKLMELVHIDGFRCEISTDAHCIKFVWRGYDHTAGAQVGISRVVSKMMLEHVNDPEDVLRCMVDCVRKGLEKMQ